MRDDGLICHYRLLLVVEVVGRWVEGEASQHVPANPTGRRRQTSGDKRFLFLSYLNQLMRVMNVSRLLRATIT